MGTWVQASEFLGGDNMGRRKRTRMRILDVAVNDGKCIISVEIRRASNTWRKAYGFTADKLKTGEFEDFQAELKALVLADSINLEADKTFEGRILMRIEDLVNQTIILD